MDSGPVKKHLKTLPGVSYVRAVRSALESFQNKLQDERIHWFMNNQNIVRISLHGSSKSALQVEALAIFYLCKKSWARMGA